jgi:hypothetical protein
VASVPEVSVSIVVDRRGAKKFRVVTSFLGAFLFSAAGFFKVGVASLLLCRLRLRISLKPSSSVGFTGSFDVVAPPAELLASILI